MEPIRTTKTARLRRLKMYREDLDEFVGLFQKGCKSMTISDSKNRYDSLDEMQSHSGPRIKDLDIRGDAPAVHFLLNQKEVLQGTSVPAVFNELRTEEITEAADILFLKLKDFLEQRQRPAVRWFFLLIAIFAFASTLLSFPLRPDPSRPPPWAALAWVALAVIFFIPALRVENLITLEKKLDSASFWVRNKEEFARHAVTAGMSALIGGLAGWLIGHFHK